MSDIYEDYRVFREQLEFDPDIDYGSAACDRLPEYILIKKDKKRAIREVDKITFLKTTEMPPDKPLIYANQDKDDLKR